MTDEDAASAVDVVIVAFNSATRLRALLPTVVGADGIGVVVVVDHGADGSASIAEAAGAVAVRDPSNPGFGAGQNHGRKLTSAPFVLVLNPDLTIDIDAVVRAVGSFADPTVAGVQGVIRRASTGAPERSAGRLIGPWHLWGRLVHARALLRVGPVRTVARRSARFSDHVDRVTVGPRPVEALGATATLFRLEALNGVGGFDERIFMYGEDQDLCARLGAAEWQLLTVPDEWAVHGDGESAPSSWERERAFWNGTLSYAALHWSMPGWLAGLAAGIVRTFTLAARRPRRSVSVVRGLVVEPIRLRRAR
jgi:N-acetylglucosaminyl-diphospho-decaprenol L-rhamnosyltransferase